MKYVVCKVSLPEWCTGYIESIKHFDNPIDALQFAESQKIESDDDSYIVEVKND